MEKTKFCDNRLAEEFDLIVLVNNAHKERGLPSGTTGRLTYSYTGRGRPVYVLFLTDDGAKREEALKLRDFRVLDAEKRKDFFLIADYFKRVSFKRSRTENDDA